MPRSSKNTRPVSHSSANATQTAKPGSSPFVFELNKPIGQEILPDKKKPAKSRRAAPKKPTKSRRAAPKKPTKSRRAS